MTDPVQPIPKVILAPRSVLLDTPHAQRLSLFYDKLALLHRDNAILDIQQLERLGGELEYLASQGLVDRLGFSSYHGSGSPIGVDFGAFSIGFTVGPPDDDRSRLEKHITRRFEVELPIHQGASLPLRLGPPDPEQYAQETDELLRTVARNAFFDERPITTYGVRHQEDRNAPVRTMEVVLKNFPLPPVDMPWQDFIEFKADSEHQDHLRRLRTWLQQRSIDNAPTWHINDELQVLLADYRQFMKLQHKKFGEGLISTVMSCTTDAIQKTLNLQFGDALRSAFDVRAKRIALTEAEMLAPGREVSYLVHAQDAFKAWP